jgi:hypothetical protein
MYDDNPPASGAGFADSGDKAPLVNENRTSLDKRQTEYNVELNMTVR